MKGGKPTLNASLGIESMISKAHATAGVEAARGNVARPNIYKYMKIKKPPPEGAPEAQVESSAGGRSGGGSGAF